MAGKNKKIRLKNRIKLDIKLKRLYLKQWISSGKANINHKQDINLTK